MDHRPAIRHAIPHRTISEGARGRQSTASRCSFTIMRTGPSLACWVLRSTSSRCRFTFSPLRPTLPQMGPAWPLGPSAAGAACLAAEAFPADAGFATAAAPTGFEVAFRVAVEPAARQPVTGGDMPSPVAGAITMTTVARWIQRVRLCGSTSFRV